MTAAEAYARVDKINGDLVAVVNAFRGGVEDRATSELLQAAAWSMAGGFTTLQLALRQAIAVQEVAGHG